MCRKYEKSQKLAIFGPKISDVSSAKKFSAKRQEQKVLRIPGLGHMQNFRKLSRILFEISKKNGQILHVPIVLRKLFNAFSFVRDSTLTKPHSLFSGTNTKGSVGVWFLVRLFKMAPLRDHLKQSNLFFVRKISLFSAVFCNFLHF